MDYFPFHAFGFRCNPFRRLTDDEWADITVLPDALQRVLDGGTAHVQVLGEAGRGKSTCLVGLEKRLRQRGSRAVCEYLPQGQDRFATSLRGLDVFLLDEAQRLRRRERVRLRAGIRPADGGPRVVLGSHEDMASEFAAHHLVLETVRLDEMTPARMHAVLARRIAYFALDDPPAVAVSPDASRYLCETFGSNLRRVEALLYEVFQNRPGPGPLTAAKLTRFGPTEARR